MQKASIAPFILERATAGMKKEHQSANPKAMAFMIYKMSMPVSPLHIINSVNQPYSNN